MRETGEADEMTSPLDANSLGPSLHISHGNSTFSGYPREYFAGVWRTGISASIYLFLTYLGLSAGGLPGSLLILHRFCGFNGLDIAECKCDPKPCPAYDQAQIDMNNFNSKLTLAGGIISVFSCSVYGVLGATTGRRLPLIMPVFGGMVGVFSQVMMPASIFRSGYLITSFLCAWCGGLYVTNQTAFAALADVTKHVSAKQRAAIYSLVECSCSVGIFIGPTLGGWVGDTFGYQNALWLPFACSALNFVIVVFTFRETLPKINRVPFNWSRANPIAAIAMFTKNKDTLLLGFVMLCGMLALDGGGTNENAYVLRTTDMNGAELGVLFTIRLGIGFVGLLFAIPVFSRCMNLQGVLAISMFNQVVGWLLLSLATSRIGFFAASAVGIFVKLFLPIIRAGMCNSFGRDRYGESLAAIATVEQLSGLISPLLWLQLYSGTEASTWGPFGCVSFNVAAIVAMVGTVTCFAITTIPEDKDQDGSDLWDRTASVMSSMVSSRGISYNPTSRGSAGRRG